MGGQNQTYCFHEPRVSESLFGRLCRREKGSDQQVRGSPGGQREEEAYDRNISCAFEKHILTLQV